MASLIHPKPKLLSSSTVFRKKDRKLSTPRNQSFFPSLEIERHSSIQHKRSSTLRVSSRSNVIDELGIMEADARSPAVSSSYRSSKIPKPNATVLEAQGKVCTGPKQTRPMSEEQACKVLETILRSAKGELQGEEEVSKAQLGAFFSAMTIRANAFPEATQWSEGERRAINTFWPLLVQVLPLDVVFLADPEGTIMSSGNSIGPRFMGQGTTEMRLVGALREVLAGGHLGYEEVQGILRDVLPLRADGNNTSSVSEALFAAFLIGQRMNGETDRELKAYCLACDDELGKNLHLQVSFLAQPV